MRFFNKLFIVILLECLFLLIDSGSIFAEEGRIVAIPDKSTITLCFRIGDIAYQLVGYRVMQKQDTIDILAHGYIGRSDTKSIRDYEQQYGSLGEELPKRIWQIKGASKGQTEYANFSQFWLALKEFNFEQMESEIKNTGPHTTADGSAVLNIVYEQEGKKVEKTLSIDHFNVREDNPSQVIFTTVFNFAWKNISENTTISEVEMRIYLEEILAFTPKSNSLISFINSAIKMLNLPMVAPLKITPETLNLTAGEGVLTAHFQAPKDHTLDDINTGSLILNGAHPLEVTIEEDKMVAKFKREDLTNIQPGEKVKFILNGELIDGTKFGGIDTIKVIQQE